MAVRVAIDALAAVHGGIVRVLHELTQELARRSGVDVEVFFAPRGFTPGQNVQLSYRQVGRRSVDVARSVDPRLSLRRSDLLISVAPSMALGPRGGTTVQIVNDLGFLHRSEVVVSPLQRLYRQASTRLSTTRADKVVCISEATSEEMRKFYPKYRHKLRTLPLPVTHVPERPIAVKRCGDSVRVLAFIHSAHKGGDLLLEAAAQAPNLEFRLVTTAQFLAQSPEIAMTASELPNATLLMGLHDRDLWHEYSRADVLAMPSRYEGYGLPVAEALCLGTPTVISNLPVLQATARGYATVMPSYDAHGLLTAIATSLAKPIDHWADASRHIRAWTWAGWVDALIALTPELAWT